MTGNKNKIIIGILVWLIFILLLIKKINLRFSSVDFYNPILKSLTFKIKKGVVVKYYGVDKATFNKWIKHFCQDIFPDYYLYKKRRTFTMVEMIKVLSVLGRLSKSEVLSKKDIINLGEGDYGSLRECIKKYPERYGISKKVYSSLRVFPPSVSKNILDQYGR